MKRERLDALSTDGVAFDVETHLIQPGLLAPPLVCGSVAAMDGERISGHLLDRDATFETFVTLIRTPSVTLIGANIAYDLLVLAVEGARRGIDLMPDIFLAYEDGRVFDVQVAEALHAIAEGHLGKRPDGGSLFSNGKVTNRYSLENCTMLVLGRENAKANDRFRMSYATLEGTPIAEWPAEARTYPIDDAVNTFEVGLEQSRTRRNLHDLSAQCYKAFALHLGAAWGVITDGTAVEALAAAAEKLASVGIEEFVRVGFIRADGSEDGGVVKRAVALAYGCSGTCAVCRGSGKVHNKFSKRDLSKPVGKPINCQTCNATGLDLKSAAVPMTEPTEKFPSGQVQSGRDILIESGDDFLMSYGAHLEDEKILSTYVPFLREGVSTPICLRPNAVLETGRVSYSGPIQLLPRQVSARLGALLREQGADVVGVRDCIRARPGWLFYSNDYTGGELVTFAESCVKRVGWSEMGVALNAGKDVHSLLGAQFIGMSYDDFVKRKKEKRCKDLRQAAKPINFGCPGGIGAVKIVLQQRKQGPDTPCPAGPSRVWDEDTSTFVPGYKGLRFCILVDGAEQCGIHKVNSWGKAGYERAIPPTCKHCIQVASRLRDGWFATWSEARPYLDWHAQNVDLGGSVEQLYSKRIRGGLDFCSEANGDFQALLADIASRALCRVTREQYVDCGTALYGVSRGVVFAHDELFGEVREEHGHEVSARITELMVEEFKKGCPKHAAACKAEPTLMSRWWKAASPRWADGRLVAWTP